MKNTNDQNVAINFEGSNILVSAGAGSGKTHVLKSRIIRQIKDGVMPSAFLVLTFTNAAAAEMKARIIKDVADLRPEIRRELEDASIKTFHGFCSDIIRSYHHYLDIDPGFAVISSYQAKELLQEACERAFNEISEKPDIQILQYGADSNNDKIIKSAESLIKYSENFVDPDKAMLDGIKIYDLSELELAEKVKSILEILIVRARKTIDIFEDSAKYVDGELRLKYIESVEIFKEQLLRIRELKKTNSKLKTITSKNKQCNLDSDLLYVEKGLSYADTSEFNDKLMSSIKEDIKKIFLEADSIIDSYEAFKSYAPMAKKHLLQIMEMASISRGYYQQEKLRRRVCDYSDLEHFALKLLENDDVVSELREQFSYIYIDEYQDSSEIQDELISKIKRSDNVFMVGDVKQSIYGFRNAAPQMFAQKIKDFELFSDEVLGADVKDVKIALKDNFRTREELLGLVNSVFEDAMNGEIVFDTESMLVAGIDYPPRNDAYELIISKEQVRAMAHRIQELVGTDVFDSKLMEYRPIRYSDIAILFSSVKKFSEKIGEVFSEFGIPAHIQTGNMRFKSVEFSVTRAILKAIDNPMNDIELTAALRSPFLGVDLEVIYEIVKDSDTGVSLYSKIKGSGRLKNELRVLERFSKMSKYISVEELLLRIYEHNQYFTKMGMLENGKTRQDNLIFLSDFAHKNSEGESLHDFLKTLDLAMETPKGVDDDNFPSDGDYVRVMTNHKSKGLEFPIVFLGALDDNYPSLERSDFISMHKKVGIGIKLENWETLEKHTNLVDLLNYEQIMYDRREEKLRELYVAMTRAKNRLVMFANVRVLENKDCFLSHVSSKVRDNTREILLDEMDKCDISGEKVQNLSKADECAPTDLINPEIAYKDFDFDYSSLIMTASSVRPEVVARQPKFMTKKNDPLVRGSVYHRALELFDFEASRTSSHKESMDAIAICLKNAAFEFGEESEYMGTPLENFIDSELFTRIKSAKKIYKERPFVNFTKGGKVQGIIDLYFVEQTEDGLEEVVLVDYKTDYLGAASDGKYNELMRAARIQAEKHSDQLEKYAAAIEKITGMRVKEKFIYFLSGGGLLYKVV